MALLGYPREHTVPRETWCQRRTQPNPARILTLEPERSEPIDDRGSDSGMVFGPARSSGLWLQIFGVEPFSFLPHCKVMAAILRAKVSRASSGFIPFIRRFS